MNKILFILLGESFREGGNESRLRDTQFGYDKQKEASNSHIKLINKLDINVDIAINTYNTKYKQELLSWYPNIIYYNFIDENYGYFCNVVNKSLEIILSKIKINDYEAVFITRFDVYLKDYFIDNIFNTKWNTIMYPFTFHVEKENISFPVVSDIMCFIPKKYFNILNKNDILQHHCCRTLLNLGLTLDDINLMINTLHNSNTIAGVNPLYRLNSREENDDWKAGKHVEKDYIYDKKSNSIIKI